MATVDARDRDEVVEDEDFVAKLADACLDVLRYDHFGQTEVHTWGVIDGDGLNDLLESHGLYYSAQQRRIGRELYEDQYGDQGHPDEGCCA